MKWHIKLIVKLIMAHGSGRQNSRQTARMFFIFFILFFFLNKVSVPSVLFFFSLFLLFLTLTFFSDPQFSSLLALNCLHWGWDQLFIQKLYHSPTICQSHRGNDCDHDFWSNAAASSTGKKKSIVLMLTEPSTKVLILCLPPAVPSH